MTEELLLQFVCLNSELAPHPQLTLSPIVLSLVSDHNGSLMWAKRRLSRLLSLLDCYHIEGPFSLQSLGSNYAQDSSSQYTTIRERTLAGGGRDLHLLSIVSQ